MINEENINCTVEALILASSEPVSIRKLGEVLDSLSPARIRQAVDDLNNLYLGCGNSFRIREVAGGYQFHILPDFEQVIKRLLVKQRTVRLSRAALETLAIIAYKQPVTKIEIEHIRGVASDGVLHNLLQRQLIVIAGRAETPGRPLLYKTSSEFLKFFGLNRLSDLPRMDEIEEMIRLAEPPKEQIILPLSGNDSETPDSEPGNGNGNGNGDGDSDHVLIPIDADDMVARVDACETAEIPEELAPPGDNGSLENEDLEEGEYLETPDMRGSESDDDRLPADLFEEPVFPAGAAENEPGEISEGSQAESAVVNDAVSEDQSPEAESRHSEPETSAGPVPADTEDGDISDSVPVTSTESDEADKPTPED